MKAFSSWLAFIIGGLLHSCTPQGGQNGRPPKSFQNLQKDPTALSRAADHAWESLTRDLIADIQGHHATLQSLLIGDTRKLPPRSVDLPEIREAELAVTGTYGHLPEVLVDQDAGVIFPQPLNSPQSFSWFQISRQAQEVRGEGDRFLAGLSRWESLNQSERIRRFPELALAWEQYSAHLGTLSRQARYLTTWIPQLTLQWTQARARGTFPPQYQLAASLKHPDARLMDMLREILRPTRVLKRAFLPDDPKGLILIPIATDVKNRKFLAEVEGALITHWNQSAWAKEQGASFHIEWTRMPMDHEFELGKITLDEHLARFPEDKAAMTTGGLTTYVHGQALVLGPGKINPRTLAHELGHLMGFADCYMRTLSAAGPMGLLGTSVLEWDNPLYPDDLMCDNTVGAARAEAW